MTPQKAVYANGARLKSGSVTRRCVGAANGRAQFRPNPRSAEACAALCRADARTSTPIHVAGFNALHLQGARRRPGGRNRLHFRPALRAGLRLGRCHRSRVHRACRHRRRADIKLGNGLRQRTANQTACEPRAPALDLLELRGFTTTSTASTTATADLKENYVTQT